MNPPTLAPHSKKRICFEAFALSIKPEQKQSISNWAAANVRLARSSRSEKADLSQTPWLVAPLEKIFDNSTSNVCIVAPVGSGKTSLLEIAVTYIVAEKSGPTLVGMLSNADAQELHETGFMPALRACKGIDNLWPAAKNSIRKDFVNFVHMPLWVGGSGLSNFQSKSCDYVFLDEAWLLKKSLLKEAARRTHDRFNSKFVLLSQAGNVGDDFAEAVAQCTQNEFHYFCPSCATHHPYEWKNLKWNVEKNEAGEYLFNTLETFYHCPCGVKFENSPQNRRTLAMGGKYVVGQLGLNGHEAFHYNALAVWWIDWNKLATEYLTAIQAKRKGNFSFLCQFYQKRMARPWDQWEHMQAAKDPLLSDYTLETATPLDKTILTFDTQLDEFWYVVRTWGKSGESRLMEWGKALTFHDLETIQKRFNLPNNCVFGDAAYRPEEVKAALVRYGWVGMNGRGDASFEVTAKGGKKVKRIYSGAKKYRVGKTGVANIYFYSSCGIKDILCALKSGNGSRWELPSDISPRYLSQLNSEAKQADGTYKQFHDDNHMFDCEAEQVVAAMMHGCYPVI